MLKFGVTRERVQGNGTSNSCPTPPRGLTRVSGCASPIDRSAACSTIALFRTFFRHARPQVEAGRIALIRTREGFRRRTVRLDVWTVAIKNARRQATPDGDVGKPAYVLMNSQRRVDYIYYRLASDDYLLLPKTALPADRTTFLDTPASKYQRFRNTFAAVVDVDSRKGHSPNDLAR